MPKLQPGLRLICATAFASGLHWNALAAQVVPEPVMTRFTYALITGHDTSWQYVLRSPGQFHSDVLLSQQGAAFQIAAVADSAGLVRRLELDIFRFAPGHPDQKWQLAQHGSYQLGPDSVFGVVRGAQREENQRFPAPAGSVIFQWNYIALLEQLVVRARALNLGTAEIPVYFFGTDGHVLPARVRIQNGSDSVIVELGNDEFKLVLDKYGRIASGSAGSRQFRHVAPRSVFPADSNITRELMCPEGTLRPDLAQIRDDPSVSRILKLYPTAWRAEKFRLLRNDSDLTTCKDLLDLFPPQGVTPQLVDLGEVYLVVVGLAGQRAGVGVVSHDLSVAHFTLTTR